MAQQERHPTRVDVATSTIEAALGEVAARLDQWKQQRVKITAEVQRLLTHGRQLLADLGHQPVDAPARRTGKGGRPRGFKTSAATKAKLRAAWARRKAAATRAADARTRTSKSRTTTN